MQSVNQSDQQKQKNVQDNKIKSLSINFLMLEFNFYMH